MNERPPYPQYIERDEELLIKQALNAVKEDSCSRAVLLYGPGGVGKTSLVRQMSEVSNDPGTRWLAPIDVDDSEYWLLSNLESKIAHRLDGTGIYFDRYWKDLSQLPNHSHADISLETVVSYLGRVKETFAQCYRQYVESESTTVVIVFDTVEAIRGTNQLQTLTRWMKALPIATLFILSGRPIAEEEQSIQDPIRTELETPHQRMSVVPIEVGGFSLSAARRYVEGSQIAEDLLGEEKDKLILLTQGQPLWLAFMIDYLKLKGIPEEADQHSLDYIEQNVPFAGQMTSKGEMLHQAFLRRLIAPYRESDFWHEAIKRFAVVRQPIAKAVWKMLMNDRALPEDAEDLDAAWERLLDMPWVRPRGNGEYVTLHDAVAEAFAQRLFPLHDQDQHWRHMVWLRALDIYRAQAKEVADGLPRDLAALDDELSRLDARPGDVTVSVPDDSEIIEHSIAIDVRKRDLDQLKAAYLYYLFLTDFGDGCQEMLDSFEQAKQEHDVFMQDLLAIYLLRFLPGGTSSSAFNDVIKARLDEFRRWLTRDRPDYYVAIGIMVARHLIESAQPEAALKLLNQLPEESADQDLRHRLHILRGNACMRVPGLVRESLHHFKQALAEAKRLNVPNRQRLIAEAHKEHGFYYRNIGQWQDADLSYKNARDAIFASLSPQSSEADRDEIASIQTNWAYVKGLNGSYSEGAELVETAITVRRRVGYPSEEGKSWSVCGEVYRYARRFEKAWAAYCIAEQLLQGRRYWSWLGLIYQEQAICLYQALQDDIELSDDQLGEAKRLIKNALDICLSHSIRSYPSALNRAGRIFGYDEPDQGLYYLEKGIDEARRLSDGWFWFANLVEYAELCYRLWEVKRDDKYRENIEFRLPDIALANREYAFPDLAGRWRVLQGHLAVHDYLRTRDQDNLKSALEHYKVGFADIARRPVGSSGAASIPTQFRAFERNFRKLSPSIRATWQAKLHETWCRLDYGSTLLLARLQELY
jgi:hypothetical protein